MLASRQKITRYIIFFSFRLFPSAIFSFNNKEVSKISSRLDENCSTYAASRFEKHGFEKNTLSRMTLLA